MRVPALLFLLGLGLLTAGCGGGEQEVAITNRYEDVRGRVVRPAFNGQALVVHHEAIPGFMESMRMTLRAVDSSEMLRVKAGDLIQFDLVITASTEAMMEGIEVLPRDTELLLSDPSTPAPDSLGAPPS